MASRFEIVSLRNADGGSTWLALLLEGEQLGQFRFAAPHTTSSEGMRALIHETAATFDRGRSAIAQFRELETISGSRRVIVFAPTALAA